MLVGCSNSIATDDATSSEKALHKQIIKEIEKKYNPSANKILIEEMKYLNDSVFALFLFSKENKEYYGLFHGKKNEDSWSVGSIDVAEVNKSVPVTYLQVVGSEDEKIKRNFQVIAGFINDRKTHSVTLIYKNGEVKVYYIAKDQKLYMDVSLGSANPPKRIIAKDSENNELFTDNRISD